MSFRRFLKWILSSFSVFGSCSFSLFNAWYSWTRYYHSVTIPKSYQKSINTLIFIFPSDFMLGNIQPHFCHYNP